jgi:hypothetical protein
MYTAVPQVYLVTPQVEVSATLGRIVHAAPRHLGYGTQFEHRAVMGCEMAFFCRYRKGSLK